MIPNLRPPNNHLLGTILCFCLIITSLQAQTKAVCQEGDCSPTILSIQLDAPLQSSTPGVATPQRTEQFKAAYLKVKQIKNGHAQDPTWSSRYQSNALGGQSCVRLNQLDGQFAYEYEQNPDFKQFIDQNELDIAVWKENGFESSRRALNLKKRMEDKCPQEVKKLEKTAGPSLADLPTTYMKLGQVQGYFDEQGNMLKPLKSIPAVEEASSDTPKMSKKEQIAQLKDKVNQLPLGPDLQGKLGGISNALGAGSPQLGQLAGALGPLNSQIDNFLPKPTGLLGKVNKIKDLLGALEGTKLKLPFSGLFSKIGDLLKKGDGLGKKVKEVANKAKQIKDKADDLRKKAKDVGEEVGKRTAAIEDLKRIKEELAKKKTELTDKLEDKPRKILDELKGQVADVEKKVNDLTNEADKEDKLKDKVLGKVEDLVKAKEEVEKQLAQLEDAMNDLTKEKDNLEEATSEVEKEMEEAKKQDKQVDDLKKALENLKPEQELEEEIANCEADLKRLLLEITGVDEKQNKLKKKLGGLLSLPSKLLGKLSDLKLFQGKLKLPKNGIPIVGKTLAKVDQLMGKVTNISATVESLTGKKTKLQEQIEGFGQKVDQVKGIYDSKVSNLDNLKGELIGLIAEKSGLKGKLDQATGDVQALEALGKDFIERYTSFAEKSDCINKEDLEQKIEELKNGQNKAEPELEDLEEKLKQAEVEEQQLETQTKELEEEIEEQVQQAETLKQEEEAIKEAYGKELKLEPVTVEEWSGSFEVERPYWEAVFHPDDEVVAGYKGRYFEVKLKDANQNVKLLFGPGEYFKSKSDFRKNYGSTIGAFVTEALHAMKKSDQSKVKLFIQGSADIVGDKTFSGKLSDQFFFEDVNILPQKADQERFESEPVSKEIPEINFRNKHLPDLRARYLKEMISVYSKKFDPIILEGIVKKFQAEEERNAIIYLFIPEEIISE